MKTRFICTGVALIITVLLLFVSCGGGAVSSGATPADSSASNAKTGSGVSAGGTGSGGGTTITGVDTNQNWDAVYAPILQGYRDAIMNDFSNYAIPDYTYDPNDLVPSRFREYYTADRFVYYAYKDIDGNGVPELLIGMGEIENLAISVEDVWTVANTGPVRVWADAIEGYFAGCANDLFQWESYSDSEGYNLKWFFGIDSSGSAVVNAVIHRNSNGDYEYYEPPSPYLFWTKVLAETPDTAYKNIAVPQNKISGDKINELHLAEDPSMDFSWSPLFTQSDRRDAHTLNTSTDGIVQPDFKFGGTDGGEPAQIVPDGGVNLRKGPGTDFDTITAIPHGKGIELLGFSKDNYDWVYVRYNNYEGWVASEFVEYSGGLDKPVIYLYPQKPMDVTVRVGFTSGAFTHTEPVPESDGAWRVKAYPGGRLENLSDGQDYPYLYWEAQAAVQYDTSHGFVIKGTDTEKFLRGKLTYMGLTTQESDEFIEYWLPRLEPNPYNLITFQGKAYTDAIHMTVTPKPDSELRVFMAYKPLDHPVNIPEQKLERFQRTGFTVIEWGGGKL